MPTLKLTARGVDALKPLPRARVQYHDTEVRGLVLRVTPQGVKTWSVIYRHRGRWRRFTLGGADVILLADARQRARDALSEAREGADPAAEKRLARQAVTIGDLVTDYLEKYAKQRKRSWREDQRMLNNVVLPAWKPRAIADIRRRDVRALLEPIAERGAPVMANRVLACVRKMFSFAVDRELVEHNPAARLGRPGGAEATRDRVLTDDELRVFWTECDGLAPEMAAFYRLRLLTAQRGKEVASMQWGDVDLEAAWWTIPAGVAKNRLAHRVPLAASALALLKQLRPEKTPAADDYVFAGARGRRQQSEAAAEFSVKDFRGHDLRRTAASVMASGGIARLTISKILNHVERGVTAVYDRHSYDAEKRAALAWWDTKLAAILEEKAGRVLAFAAGAAR
jgi:integrase